MKISNFIFCSSLFCHVISTSTHGCQAPIDGTSWKPGQVVHTTSGPVRGLAASKHKYVSVYRGIPYAQPPTGNLRFASPKEFRGNKVINATRFGSSCPITKVFGGYVPANTTGKSLTEAGLDALRELDQPYDTFSEDCLTVNVWTKPQVGEQRKAILVWIHGGGYSIGSSSSPTFDGQHFVEEQDVVVVSFNYRTNIFGFPGNPLGPLNPGLLDQRLAIEWIYKNIAAFHGDPNRITLFGQSAGAGSIDLYSYTYASNPLITGIILQSGSVNLGTYEPSETAQGWFAVSQTLGCGGNATDAAKVLKCLRGKTTTEITGAIPLQNQATGSALFYPTIDNNFVYSNYSSRIPAAVPLLIGNTDHEAGYFQAISSVYNATQPDEFWKFFQLATFTCPAGARANISVAADNPTWRYVYTADFPSLRLRTVEQGKGAWHGGELGVLFGTTDPIEGREGKQVDELGHYLRKLWGLFAKNPERGLKRLGWKEYVPGKERVARLGLQNRMGLNIVDGDVYDSECASLKGLV